MDDVDFDSFRDEPLDPDALRCLRYMHDVEHNTIIYLRDVLVTDAHLDHEITSFLTFWAFEEYFHGEAIGRVLEAHGEPGSDERVPQKRRPTLHDRIIPVGTMLASHVTRHVPTVHMTWGAINEWTAQAAYGRLVAKAQHPTLSTVLHRIMKQEGRHIDFYAVAGRAAGSTATGGPRRSPAGRCAGSGPRSAPASTTATRCAFMAHYLFGDTDGQKAASRIDRCIDRLPGLSGLGLVASSAR